MAPGISLPFSRHSLTFSGLCFADDSVSKETPLNGLVFVCKTDLTQVICPPHDILNFTNGLPKNPPISLNHLKLPGDLFLTTPHLADVWRSQGGFNLFPNIPLAVWESSAILNRTPSTTWKTGNKTRVPRLSLVCFHLGVASIQSYDLSNRHVDIDCCNMLGRPPSNTKFTTYCKPNNWKLTPYVGSNSYVNVHQQIFAQAFRGTILETYPCAICVIE